MGEVPVVGQTIAFCRLLGWAFGPRKLMKNWHHGKGGSGEVGLTVEKSRSFVCLTLEHARFCANNWASLVSLTGAAIAT
jgi:hypothetical protein